MKLYPASKDGVSRYLPMRAFPSSVVSSGTTMRWPWYQRMWTMTQD